MEPIFFADAAQWRDWLEANHATASEVLVGHRKRATGQASMTWSESVDEALCLGWIDGVRRRLDDDSYVIRFTPRKPGSHWSRVNVDKVGALEAHGRMRPAGRSAFAARREDRTARAAYERGEDAVLTADEQARFEQNGAAWAWFEAQPPWYRRTALHWVTSPKRAETRDRRLTTLIACSAQGRTVPPLTR